MDYEIPSHFRIILDPLPNPDAVVKTEHARFTLLTSRMIRMEWSPTGHFEDRASQAFWFRAQVAPQFTVKQTDQELVIETEALRLTYVPDQAFTNASLSIKLKESGETWFFGDPDPQNLGGTARTVDGVDGATPLSLGLISRSGWSLVDDSKSLVFNKMGWLESREAPEEQLDLYFMGYGHDYYGCLREFNRVAGAVPMIPRFVLGNWWSRYWEYSQDELEQLIKDFQEHEVPLSVCIIDMDWHITKTGNNSSGWTGYTWNRELFPDPEGILEFLHEKDLKVALNLHPAEGLHPHEEMYAEMCKAVGMDPDSQEPVEFDITNPRFVDAYFRILHHPQEARGIDFWWMDWQQGQRTRLSGLDPLWWLNHLHFLDLGRDGKRRSFIFSRWGGLGNHRYPIGFSGDSVVSWASLAFQPYFTATASNVNYGWWSHDIGGHMAGVEDAELYTRWVQLGAFQPVLRLHSTKNPYHERRPWGFDAETFTAARNALQLRHALIPYLYSMAWRYHQENIPPLVPMYYDHPEQDDAYACPNQYMFGNQLVAAPFIAPKDEDTRLSRSVVWLPEGDWYNFFTGEYMPSGWQAVYGTLRDIPVFAKAGAIVPQGPMAGWNNVEAPVHLMVNVFPGADGEFELYEDEGNTNAYLDDAYAITPMRQEWKGSQTRITIGPVRGKHSLLPEARRIDLVLRGFAAPHKVDVRLNGIDVEMDSQYSAETSTLRIEGMMITPTDWLEVVVTGKDDLAVRTDPRLSTLLRMVKAFRLQTNSKSDLAADLPKIVEDPGLLVRYLSALTNSQMRALMEVVTGAGMDYTESTGSPLIVAWNNHQDKNVTLQFSLARQRHWWKYKERNLWVNDALPRFQSYHPAVEFGELNPWVVQASYYGMNVIRFEGR
jgi:hypothetical protein